MTIFERFLTLWVFLCIVVGITLGQFFPVPFQAIGRLEIASVNLPVGLLIWVMIVPMLLPMMLSLKKPADAPTPMVPLLVKPVPP